MSPLSTIAILLAMISLSAPYARAAATPATVRMETTNRAESAPLNITARAFRALEPFFEDTIQSQRLTYRLHRAPGGSEPIETSLKRLMVNIGGGLAPHPTAATVRELTVGSDEALARTLLTHFSTTVSQVISSRGRAQELSAIPLAKLHTALHALAARPDVKVFSADVLDEGFASRVLILMDEETSELLLLYVTRQPNEV